MVRLNTKDMSILSRVAQLDRLSMAQREEMLDDAGQTAKQIGRIVIGRTTSGSTQVKQAAKVVCGWAKKNKEWSRLRRQRVARARAAR